MAAHQLYEIEVNNIIREYARHERKERGTRRRIEELGR